MTPPLTKQSFWVDLDPRWAEEKGILGATVRLFTVHKGKDLAGPVLYLRPGLRDSGAGHSATTVVLADRYQPMIAYTAI